MTREHKLALLIGFALVLVVGVVVSDHFSGAHKSRLAEVFNDPTAQPTLAAVNQATHLSNPLPVDNPVVDTSGVGPTIASRTLSTDGGATTGSEALKTALANGAGEEVGSNTFLVPTDFRPPAYVPAVATDTTRTQAPIETPGGAGQTNTGNTSGLHQTLSDRGLAFPTHVVKKGDTLWSIAALHYNDGNLSRKLAEFNSSKGRIGPDNTLFMGASLLIPPKDVLTGKKSDVALTQTPVNPKGGISKPEQAQANGATHDPVGNTNPLANPKQSPAKPEAKPGAKTPTAKPSETKTALKPEPAKPTTRTYTVQKGDTLATIAQKTLGSAKRWREIETLNKMDDPDSVEVGSALKIPAK